MRSKYISLSVCLPFVSVNFMSQSFIISCFTLVVFIIPDLFPLFPTCFLSTHYLMYKSFPLSPCRVAPLHVGCVFPVFPSFLGLWIVCSCKGSLRFCILWESPVTKQPFEFLSVSRVWRLGFFFSLLFQVRGFWSCKPNTRRTLSIPNSIMHTQTWIK